MKRTGYIRVGLTTAIALGFTACGEPRREAQRCVDQDGMVVDDRQCQGHSGSGFYPYHYYYGGSGFYPGQIVTGGSSTPSAGARPIMTSDPSFSSVSRGGFGATAEASGHAGGSAGGGTGEGAGE